MSEPTVPSQIDAETPAKPSSARPEILAPAGDWECARAAVENGADAIYFGLDRHNARIRANNFTLEDLPELMRFLHRRGVRGYLTFNTLVFPSEWEEVRSILRAAIAAGVDAAIVQDVGVCHLIRDLSPDFRIHASTQMTVTSATGVAFARSLGCARVVLARECTLKEIQRIRQALREQAGEAMDVVTPLEVFVHGALCVAYSGQCLTSESLGGRSANRGECAQACRMPYDLVCDGRQVPLGDRRYLLSPQDLAALDLLPQLLEAGVGAFKIEGRLKTPEYVANITRTYRTALDRWQLGQPATATEKHATRYDMEMSFSRGLFTGWLGGIDNQALVHARFGKKRGVYLGEVGQVRRDAIFLKAAGPIKPGDGVVFDAGRPEEKEEGGRVYQVGPLGRDGLLRLAFGDGDLDFRRIQVGDKVWKTSDPELEKRLRRSFEGDVPRFQRPLDLMVDGALGQPMIVRARADDGSEVSVASSMPMEAAMKQPLTVERLEEQLGRLGGTPFRLGRLVSRLQGNVLVPFSEMNRLRRELVEELLRRREMGPRWTLRETAAEIEAGPDPAVPAAPASPELIALVRTLPQLESALRTDLTTFYCELEDPKRFADAVRMVRHARHVAGLPRTIWVAPPRIAKEGEDWILRTVQGCGADGYLVRNYDNLRFFGGARCVGDYTLNVANARAARHFLAGYGLERVTASYDLDASQLAALLRSAPPAWFEITIHQHMPMFHMEHCVFCAFLTKGSDFTNCGRPCDVNELRLRDRVGAEHPIKADAGCRNTVFNALAQTGAEFVGDLLALGARRFRVEFLQEKPEEVTRTIGHYQRLLRQEITGSQLWRELKIVNQLGVTRGTLGKAMGTVGSRNTC